MKQKMIQNLLAVIKQLQNHLLNQHQYISGQKFSCQNCELYTLKQDLVQKELTLLHYELERMSQTRNRRISISGIPSERIFNLATRTYSVCEEHREMHLDSKRRQSMCQHSEETMDSDDNDHIEGPLMVKSFIFSFQITIDCIGTKFTLIFVNSLQTHNVLFLPTCSVHWMW